MMWSTARWLSGHEQWTDFQEKQGASSPSLDFIVTPIKFQLSDCCPEFDTIYICVEKWFTCIVITSKYMAHGVKLAVLLAHHVKLYFCPFSPTWPLG